MISYVIAENPDDRILAKACLALDADQVIAFPTDTSWVLAANLFSKKAVESLYRLKGIDKKKHLSVLCNNISQASRFAVISDSCFRRIRSKVPGPYTFIFAPSYEIPRTIKDYRKDNQIGIRIPQSILCSRLIERYEHPILATSITRSMLSIEEDDESFEPIQIFSYQIEEAFPQLQIILDPGEFHSLGGSSVIDFSTNGDSPIVIREGAGDVSSFL